MSRSSDHSFPPSSTPVYHSYQQPQQSAAHSPSEGGYPYSSDPRYPVIDGYTNTLPQPYQQYSSTDYSTSGYIPTHLPYSAPTSTQHYIPSPQFIPQHLASPQPPSAYQSPQQFSTYSHLSPQHTYSPAPALPPSQSIQIQAASADVKPTVAVYNSAAAHIDTPQSSWPAATVSETTPFSDTTKAPQPSLKIKFTLPEQPIQTPPIGSVPPGTQPMSSGYPTRHSQSTATIREVNMSTSGKPQRAASQRARAQVSYREDDDDFEDVGGEEDAVGEVDDDDYAERNPVKSEWGVQAIRPKRAHKAPERFGEEEELERKKSSPAGPVANGKRTRRVIHDPDESDGQADEPVQPRNAFPPRATRNSLASAQAAPIVDPGPSYTNGSLPKRGRPKGKSRERHSSADGEDFEPTDEDSPSEGPSSDPLGNYEEEEDADDLESFVSDSPKRRSTRSAGAARPVPPRRSTRSTKRHDDDSDDEYGGGRRNLRARTSKPNYHIPTMDDLSKEISMAEAIAAVSRPRGRPAGTRGLAGGVRFGAAGGAPGLPWHMKGLDLPQAMGDPDTSDSDDFATPLKSGAAGPSLSNTAAVARSGAGGPSDVPNYGRINPKSSMADADPLGVDMNVTFDNVGGLDDHINQLKEMVALPLLYPELFQQFGITPPRGVLFHGPPGTGKTLLARALAASCSTGNTKIAFFMRKGADVLSKWVGEAERQLRMLFEEARAAQPSIIFFDEIDGLAPVRSSKQDQIHASLVSTLLALMDGMDGRGQVIVIGATNRPDAVDPALRRPGRFDREFYFPLPNRAARKKIIGINTRKWEPKLSDEFLDKLAVLTKGYGGADLRALCTEAALNAIQRRYPQIYKTPDRLQLETGSIHVQAKDFMMSIKKIVPSSARSTSSAAIQLPQHLLPLLSAPLERLKAAIDHVLPPKKHRTALEEAEYEEEEGDSFEKHMMLQSLDKLRTFRPRILVHGEPGLGQTYLGPAVLHHLEGFHVQSFDLGTLMGDSTRSVEAAVVQLFVEAKRHQPSVIFIPSLTQWANTITDTARATVRALLDGIPPSDPILLLGMADGPVDKIPADVLAWFGFAPENKIGLALTTPSERAEYFADLIASVRRPPSDFPDAVPRRKRVLDSLPLAAPLPPRQPTEAEIAREEEKDQSAKNMIILSFTALLQEFMKRFRKVVLTVKEDAMAYERYLAEQAAIASVTTNPIAAAVAEDDVNPPVPINTDTINGDHQVSEPAVATVEDATIDAAVPVATPAAARWHAHPIDIDTIHRKLVKHKYFTPADFLDDVAKIEENAERLQDPDRQAKIAEMAANARLHVAGFDPKWTPEFARYAERMNARKAERQKRRENEAKAEAEKLSGARQEIPVNGDGANSKRVREGDDQDDENSQGREKRSRDEAMEVDPMPSSAIDTINTPIPAPAAAELPLSAEASEPPPFTSVGRPATADPIATIQPPRSPPQFEQPPFVVPAAALSSLTIALRESTMQLSVDQLEQLRASLFDKLWRNRGEWDRTAVVDEMVRALFKFTDGVRKWKEQGGWQGQSS